MLNEQEYEELHPIYIKCIEAVKQYRRDTGVALADIPKDILYKPAIDLFRQLTGYEVVDMPHIYQYHRIERYGPPCPNCGKALRTKQAKFCFVCSTAIE